MSNFSKRLREFTQATITSGGEHSRSEIVEAFIDGNPDLVDLAIRELAIRQINQTIASLCDSDADSSQSDLFDGLPVAIAFGDGRVKAIEHCTVTDLAVGRTLRQENVRSAREKLRRYNLAVEKIQDLTVSESDTVGTIAARIAQVSA